MSPAFPNRRRADQFDALVEGTLTQAPSAELAELAALAEGLRAAPEVTPRADFAASLRERLMEAAPEALASPAGPATEHAAGRLTVAHRTPSKTSRERRIGVAIAAFSIVGATAVSAVASQGSLPGDTLYPVKRLIEDARTSLTMGQDAKADVLLSQARTRLDEARSLGSESDVDTSAVEQALQDFGDTANHASTILLAQYADHGNAQDITELRTFAQQSVTTLAQLADLLPPSLDGALADATTTLLTIDHSAAQACSACGGGVGITELPSTLVDLLAARPAGAATTSSVGTPPATTKTGKPRLNGPSSVPSPATGGSATGPLTGVTGPLTGGSPSKPGSAPTSLGGVVGGAGGAVGGAVGGVGGALGDAGGKVGGPVGGVLGGAGDAVGGVGDAVGGVTGGVGNTLDGVGGLLSPSPTTQP
ncbi:hypothetical protein GCM10009798_12200 [Nocardioides panacihumi]|uniref:DUF5667 domain-containing protein n=1 Tax=Nocardioides panacihumi TaxID=400774 RepID=A0ABP5C0I8_9ACTN